MTTNITDLESLEQFVVDNDRLLELEARIGRFNIFDALGIVNAEIRHSNFLAWLLDPSESHGLGGLFLKAVLMDLLRQTPVEQRLFSPIVLDGGELRGVEVRREWKNIDLLITCDDPSFVIAIENKVGSGEHSDQLNRYRKIIEDAPGLAKHAHRQFVFLTPEGDSPSDEAWTEYSYADLFRVLSRVRRAAANQIGDDVSTFLDHYLRLIGTRFMNDDRIDELCNEIYKNHRQAIKLILDRVDSDETPAIDAAAEVLEADSRWIVLNRTGKHLYFIPAVWKDALVCSALNKNKPEWIYFDFNTWDTPACGLNLCMRATDPAEFRQACFDIWMEDTKTYGMKHRKSPLKPDWNSLNRDKVASWKKDDEVPVDRIQSVMQKLLDSWHPRCLAVLSSIHANTG